MCHLHVFINLLKFCISQIQHYILVVQAQDAGTIALTSTAMLYINVIDVNDNAPVFEPRIYTQRIPENIPKGSEVIKLQATDKDSGWYRKSYTNNFVKNS